MSMATKLTIHKIETRPVVVPLREPITTSSGAVSETPLVLIDLLTQEGVTGRAYVFAYHTFALKPLNDLVQALGGLIGGDVVAPFDIERELRSRFTLLGGAKNLAGIAIAGIDMAAWDALACGAAVPLVTLLGGTRRPVPAYKSLGMISALAAPDAAANVVKGGYRGAKIKIGWPSLGEDLSVVRAMRKNLPDEVHLMVDYNQSLSVTEAIRRGRVLDDEGVAWIEEPVRCDDFEGCARVAVEVETPIQLGENFSGLFDMQSAIRANASDLLMPDIQQIGGVTGWLRASALAHAAGKEVSAHIFIEISTHVLPITPSCQWLEHLDIASTVIAEPFPVVNGMMQAPDRLGAGMAWNDEAVKKYTVT